MISKAYKTELDPNNVQRTLLAKHAGVARFAWNWGLARSIEEYKLTGKSSNAVEQHKQLNALKPTEFPWMYEGSKLLKADRFFPSTKTCSACGVIKEMPLSERTYRCDGCGLIIDRDLNAARNLLSNVKTNQSRGTEVRKS